MILIDLHTEEGIVGRSYLEPYLERSVRYLIPAIRDLAEMRKGQRIAPFDDFGTGRARLNLIGLEGVSMIAASALDMAELDRSFEGLLQVSDAPLRAALAQLGR